MHPHASDANNRPQPQKQPQKTTAIFKTPLVPPCKAVVSPFNVENLVDNMWITCPLFFFADIGNILPPFSVL